MSLCGSGKRATSVAVARGRVNGQKGITTWRLTGYMSTSEDGHPFNVYLSAHR
jgi:hypothetical protein